MYSMYAWKSWQNINCSAVYLAWRNESWSLDCKKCFCQVAFCKQNGLQNKILPNSKIYPKQKRVWIQKWQHLGKSEKREIFSVLHNILLVDKSQVVDKMWKTKKYFLNSTIFCLLTKAKCGETWRAQNKIFSWYHRRVTSQQFCEYFKRNNFKALHTHRESHIINIARISNAVQVTICILVSTSVY